MKKTTYTTLIALIISMIAYGQDNESYTALKVTGDNVPVIDGTIDAVWQNVTIVPLEKVPKLSGAVHPNITEPDPTDSDFSAEIGMLWNNDGIFFLFTVVDDAVVIFEDYDASNDTPADKWWADDNINILFSKDLVNSSFTQWEFAWQPGINQEEKLSSDDWLNAALIDISLVSSAWYNEGDSWTLETFIDWGAFNDGNTAVSDGMSIFLEARARDDDDDEATDNPWETMFQWSTDNYDVESSGEGMGEVTLSADEAEGPASVSDNSLPFDQLALFPNPSHGIFDLQITLDEPGDVSVLVLDISGRCIRELVYADRSAANNLIPVNLENTAAGTYLIRVQSKNNSGVLKYIKQ